MLISLQILNGLNEIYNVNNLFYYSFNIILIILIFILFIYFFNKNRAKDFISKVAFILHIPFTLLILVFAYLIISIILFSLVSMINLEDLDFYIVMTFCTLACLILSIPTTLFVKKVVRYINPLLDTDKVFSVCYFIIFLFSASSSFVYSFIPLFFSVEEPNTNGFIILFILLIGFGACALRSPK